MRCGYDGRPWVAYRIIDQILAITGYWRSLGVWR